MKIIHFVSTAGSEEYMVSAKEIKTIKVADTTSVICYITSLDPAVAALSNVKLTVTSGKSDEVALKIAQIIAKETDDVTTIVASGTGFSDVTTITWTDGV